MRNGLGEVQTVLVLGGGSDIAHHTVLRLIEGRCRTVILAARRPSELQGRADEYRAKGAADVELVEFDGADAASHDRVLGAVFDSYRDVDLVISAFGVLGDQDHFDASPTDAAAAANVNFAGQVSALLVCAQRLRQQGHGTIVVLSSVAGERVRADNPVYGATKAGLDAFAQGLGDRLAGSGVHVMVVRPGFVRTKMTEGMDDAPFATTPEKVASNVVDGLTRGAAVVWSPGILRWVFTALRHLPRPLWRRVSAR